MGYSELIHDLTDGTLAADKEHELFHLLAQNDEYRSELKQQLAIKSAIKNDYKAFTPAASSTMNIFSSVGFAPPVTAPIAGTAIGAVAVSAIKSAGFWAHYGSSIITGVVATLATAVVAYYIFQPQILDLNGKNEMLSKQLVAEKVNNNIPVVSSSEISGTDNKRTDVNSKIHSSNKPLIKYVYITKVIDNTEKDETKTMESPVEVNTNQNENIESIQVFVPDKSSFISGAYGNNSFNRFSNEKYSKLSVVPMDLSDLVRISKDLGITVEFKKMENWFDMSPTISPKNLSKFNNTSLGILYEILNGLQAGGELRQETFFQRFTGFNEKHERYQYDQQPNFTSYAMVLRYSNKDFNLWGIYPFGQGAMGFTNVGYITRLMGGLKYSPYQNITFILGAEASGLFYKHGGASFDTYKYDLNYGISFGF